MFLSQNIRCFLPHWLSIGKLSIQTGIIIFSLLRLGKILTSLIVSNSHSRMLNIYPISRGHKSTWQTGVCAWSPLYDYINLWTALSDSLLSAVFAHSTPVYIYIYLQESQSGLCEIRFHCWGGGAHTQCALTIEILSLYVLLHSLPRFFYPLFFALPLFILDLSIDGYDEIVITIVFRLNRPLRQYNSLCKVHSSGCWISWTKYL